MGDFQCDDDDDDDIMIVDAPVAKTPAFAGDGDGDGGGDDDEELAVMGVNNANSIGDYPHSRNDCPTHKFVHYSIPSNTPFCQNCYCYVCDEKASTCVNWQSHQRTTTRAASGRGSARRGKPGAAVARSSSDCRRRRCA